MRMDRVEAELLDPVDRGMEPDRADDVRRARLEPRRRIEEGRLLERHLLDHRPAALPRRHCGKQLGAAPQAADAGRAVQLVRRRRRRNRRRSPRRRPAGAAPPGSRRAAAARPSNARSRPRAWRRGSSRGRSIRGRRRRRDAPRSASPRRRRGRSARRASAARRRFRNRRAATARCCCDARAATAGRGCGRPWAASRATRLIASVAPRVKTSSSGWPPISFEAAARAAS